MVVWIVDKINELILILFSFMFHFFLHLVCLLLLLLIFIVIIFCIFFSLGFSGSTVGVAVRPVAATNQDLSPSHVMRRGSANAWRAWLERSVTTVAVVTTVSMPMAAQVNKQVTSVSLDTNWSSLSTLIGCSFSSQHAPVITLEGTVTLRVVSASAPPTQTETPVTGVRPDTGVTTLQQAARYTQIHKIYT